MKRIVLALVFLALSASATLGQAQAGTGGQQGNLRGLTGVRLVVMFHGATRAEAIGETRAEGLEELQRPEVLKMLEDDTKAKLQEAGIPFSRSRFADEIGKAGATRLKVLVTFDQLNGFETEVTLLERVRLVRDPSIEIDATTWSAHGVGNKLEISMIRHQIAGLIDNFIRDYLPVNPKQSVSSGKDKSTDTKH